MQLANMLQLYFGTLYEAALFMILCKTRSVAWLSQRKTLPASIPQSLEQRVSAFASRAPGIGAFGSCIYWNDDIIISVGLLHLLATPPATSVRPVHRMRCPIQLQMPGRRLRVRELIGWATSRPIVWTLPHLRGRLDICLAPSSMQLHPIVLRYNQRWRHSRLCVLALMRLRRTVNLSQDDHEFTFTYTALTAFIVQFISQSY